MLHLLVLRQRQWTRRWRVYRKLQPATATWGASETREEGKQGELGSVEQLVQVSL